MHKLAYDCKQVETASLSLFKEPKTPEHLNT